MSSLAPAAIEKKQSWTFSLEFLGVLSSVTPPSLSGASLVVAPSSLYFAFVWLPGIVEGIILFSKILRCLAASADKSTSYCALECPGFLFKANSCMTDIVAGGWLLETKVALFLPEKLM